MENMGAAELKTIREKKGESLFEFPESYVIIDIETTGLSPKFNEIIEISAIRIKNGEIVDEFSELIKPEYEIDYFITQLTGITNEMVENSRSIKDVLSSFKDFISKDDIVSGYNVNFDINFLYDNFLGHLDHYFENNFVDVMRIAKRSLNGEVDSFRMKRLAKHFNISTKGMHRGLVDCKITLELFDKVKEEVIKKFETYEKFIELKKPSMTLNCKEIKSANEVFDIEHPCYEKQFVFTGTLKMPRREAMQLVVDFGGKVKESITKEANFLVMGVMDYTKNVAGEKSSKIIKAENLKLKGHDLEIISEDVFLDMFQNSEKIIVEKTAPEIKFEKNLYNKMKALIILLSHKNSIDSIEEEINRYNFGSTEKMRELSKKFSSVEKLKMFNECLEEKLLILEEELATKTNYFNKLTVSELKEILEKGNIEAFEKTKKPLIEKIVKNINLTEYNFKPLYIWTKKGQEFRNYCE